MKRLFAILLLALTVVSARADEASWLPIEKEVAEAVKAPTVTVVHFWASWCPNCKAELVDNGWSGFIKANPDVRFIFISTWHTDDGRALLEQFGVGGQANFTLLHHPNTSRKGDERMKTFLDLPVSWLPTTWVFREGKLRYALNYGEVSFPVLQQFISDSTNKWSHAKPKPSPAPAATP